MSAFVTKLSARFPLSFDDQEALKALPSFIKNYVAGARIASEDKPSEHVGIVVRGFASRYKLVKGSDRQITGFLLAGDAIDIPSIWLGKPSAHVVSNKETQICWFNNADMRNICLNRPNIAAALWLDTLVDAGIAQEWMANVGQRSARERMAHLLLELAYRQLPDEALQGNTFELPFNQTDLACALGLSLVHTNKSLRFLENSGAVRRVRNIIEIIDRSALAAQIGFDPSYLWPVLPSLPPGGLSTFDALARQAQPSMNL